MADKPVIATQANVEVTHVTNNVDVTNNLEVSLAEIHLHVQSPKPKAPNFSWALHPEAMELVVHLKQQEKQKWAQIALQLQQRHPTHTFNAQSVKQQYHVHMAKLDSEATASAPLAISDIPPTGSDNPVVPSTELITLQMIWEKLTRIEARLDAVLLKESEKK